MTELWLPYENLGEDFERHAQDSAHNAHYDRPAVLAALGEVRGLHVLDAACGPGLYADALVGAGATVVGFDASVIMVDLARRRLGDRAVVDLARLGQPLPTRTPRSTGWSARSRSTTSTTGRRPSPSSTGCCGRVVP